MRSSTWQTDTTNTPCTKKVLVLVFGLPWVDLVVKSRFRCVVDECRGAERCGDEGVGLSLFRLVHTHTHTHACIRSTQVHRHFPTPGFVYARPIFVLAIVVVCCCFFFLSTLFTLFCVFLLLLFVVVLLFSVASAAGLSVLLLFSCAVL